MSAPLVRELMAKAKPGYRAVVTKGGLYAILGPDGAVVRDPQTNQPIKVNGDSKNIHYRRRALAHLREAGVVPAVQRRAHERHEPVKIKGRVNDHVNPILLANEILRDPKSTPRERSMARSYRDLLETHLEVKALAATLGKRIRWGERDERAYAEA